MHLSLLPHSDDLLQLGHFLMRQALPDVSEATRVVSKMWGLQSGKTLYLQTSKRVASLCHSSASGRRHRRQKLSGVELQLPPRTQQQRTNQIRPMKQGVCKKARAATSVLSQPSGFKRKCSLAQTKQVCTNREATSMLQATNYACEKLASTSRLVGSHPAKVAQ